METLPSEVYSQIVQLLRPNGKRTPRHLLPPEITLSHVSAEWRRLAFSDSKSWEMVEVYSPRTLPRAAAYVARSANAAVSLRVELYDYEVKQARKRPASEHKDFLASLGKLIQDAAPRCKSTLIFTHHERTAQELLLALKTADAPLLQSFRVEINDAADEDDDESEHEDEVLTLVPIFTSGNVESLRTVWIETPAIPPLQHITTLHLHSVSPDWFSFGAFTRIAAEAVSLENLSLTSRSFITDWPSHLEAPGITLPSLKNLLITDDHPGLTVKAMLSIDAPNLESLFLRAMSTTFHGYFESPQINVAVDYGSVVDATDARNANQETKFPKLQYLTLEFWDMVDTALFARAFPTITHLRIAYGRLFASASFAQDISEEFLWPNLHTSVFDIERDTRGDRLRNACVKIVTSRKLQGLPVPRLVGDEDVLEILGQSDFLNESARMERLDVESYREPWWIMKHVKVVEGIGML